MVINNTSAVAVKIHAVSAPLIVPSAIAKVGVSIKLSAQRIFFIVLNPSEVLKKEIVSFYYMV